jgi:nicotinamide-nucleotide amidase
VTGSAVTGSAVTGSAVASSAVASSAVASSAVTSAAVTGPEAEQEAREVAAAVLSALTAAGQTVAVAESLTGGLVAAALASVPGASAAFRGGVVAYATDLKAALLGVDAGLLARCGAVDPDVAAAMAAGARSRLGATAGAATTGVAGPDPSDGQPVGTVFIAADAGAGPVTRRLSLTGNRNEIRRAAATECLRLLLGVLREENV